MAKPQGRGDLVPSIERRRGYVRQLQRMADGGDATAITNYLLLTHVGALDFSNKRKGTQA